MVKVIVGDASEYWEEEINNACESIVIFTPYFDSLLVGYLEECDLPYACMTLVTQIDWIDSRGENQQRIIHLLNLIERGVAVRILNRLHAKVLIVDDEIAYFGSQNFTRYSTESYEITTRVENDEDFDDLFRWFESWLDDSYTPSTEELIESTGNTIYLDDGRIIQIER